MASRRRRRETTPPSTRERPTQDLPHVRALDVADAQAVAGAHLEALAGALLHADRGPHIRAHVPTRRPFLFCVRRPPTGKRARDLMFGRDHRSVNGAVAGRPKKSAADAREPQGGTEAQNTSRPRQRRHEPSYEPTVSPTPAPSHAPSYSPSVDPTFEPTHLPTYEPSAGPSPRPTPQPSSKPTAAPSYATPCVEMKILRRVRAESSRRPPCHRRDACSMAW